MKAARGEFVLVGGSGPVGRRLIALLSAAGADITVIDPVPPHPDDPHRVTWLPGDLLSDDISLPPGVVVLLLGEGESPRWPWRAPLEVAVPTARLLPALEGRDVVLPLWDACPPSTVAGPGEEDLTDWCRRLTTLTNKRCDRASVAGMCRELVDALAGDAAMRRALAAQRVLLVSAEARLRDLRTVAAPELSELPELPEDTDASAHAWARALARVLLGSCGAAADMPEPAVSSESLFHPPLPVVIPPRPALPDVVAARQQEAMWSGQLKAGNVWGNRCLHELRAHLQLGADYELLLTTSGTAALELAIVATAGPAVPGAVALLPSFTFRATVDVLLRLGYGIRYVDVNPFTWTLDAAALARALDDERVRLVVAVDTFGNPCSYEALGPLCAARGVTLVADSAAGFGSRYRGRPVGQQADAHSFSMSFAKVLTAAGAGGAVTFRRDTLRVDLSDWTGSQLMNEMHAIAALDQLAVLDRMVAVRGEVAAAYAAVLQGLSGISTQQVAPGDVHSYVHYVARVPERDAFAGRLAELGVLTKPYFPAQHRHHAGALRGDRLPVTEQLDAQALAFPTSSELTERQVQRVQRALQIAVADVVDAGAPHAFAAGDEARDA